MLGFLEGLGLGVLLSILGEGIWKPVAASAGKLFYRKARSTAVAASLESLDALLLPEILNFLDQAIIPQTQLGEDTGAILAQVAKDFDLSVLLAKAQNG